jgi:Nucleotide modification associated domain 2
VPTYKKRRKITLIDNTLRTYIYKLTSARGGAPCVPQSRTGQRPYLTLAICKPAIRRTAQPGDRILGITSRSLANREGYPLGAVIYAAKVSRTLDPGDYYNQRGEFRSRPDCIYAFHRATGTLQHTGRTGLHDDPAYAARDIGRYPYYRNARTLLCEDFRYFGAKAILIPGSMSTLLKIVDGLGQGHRVFEETSPLSTEVGSLFKLLWKVPTSYTPAQVEEEAYDHAPRRSSSAKKDRTRC